jgi:hypothetical protein
VTLDTFLSGRVAPVFSNLACRAGGEDGAYGKHQSERQQMAYQAMACEAFRMAHRGFLQGFSGFRQSHLTIFV